MCVSMIQFLMSVVCAIPGQSHYSREETGLCVFVKEN